tara:strand:+ start:1724 stop:2047 length:324 start_codon:yes stop_codon:yes gene_type:complete
MILNCYGEPDYSTIPTRYCKYCNYRIFKNSREEISVDLAKLMFPPFPSCGFERCLVDDGNLKTRKIKLLLEQERKNRQDLERMNSGESVKANLLNSLELIKSKERLK